MFEEDHLIALLQQRKRAADPPPLTEAEVVRAEEQLGFTLPPLLRRLYREVSNGGFGRWVAPLVPPMLASASDEDESILGWYQREHPAPAVKLQDELALAEEIPLFVWPLEDEPLHDLPEELLLIGDHGCNIYSYLDCAQPGCPVLLNDNNISSNTFAVKAESLHEWLEGPLQSREPAPFKWETARKIRFPSWSI